MLTAMILLWSAVPSLDAMGQAKGAEPRAFQPSLAETVPERELNKNPQTSAPSSSGYEGKTVQSIELPGSRRSRSRTLAATAAAEGRRAARERDRVRDSIRALYATGRFADIQAEVVPSGDGVALTFVTSPNFFVGAVRVEGAPTRPTANQIVNASKLQLGELYSRDKLNRALENIRQLMQENGYYRARVTAESTSNPANQQVDILFHITPGSQAHVGDVKVTGTSSLSSVTCRGSRTWIAVTG